MASGLNVASVECASNICTLAVIRPPNKAMRQASSAKRMFFNRPRRSARYATPINTPLCKKKVVTQISKKDEIR